MIPSFRITQRGSQEIIIPRVIQGKSLIEPRDVKLEKEMLGSRIN